MSHPQQQAPEPAPAPAPAAPKKRGRKKAAPAAAEAADAEAGGVGGIEEEVEDVVDDDYVEEDLETEANAVGPEPIRPAVQIKQEFWVLNLGGLTARRCAPLSLLLSDERERVAECGPSFLSPQCASPANRSSPSRLPAAPVARRALVHEARTVTALLAFLALT